MACALLEYICENHLDRQTDVPFLEKTIRDGSIIIPMFEKDHKNHLKEFPLEKFDELGRTLIQEKRELYPFFLKLLKSMYAEVIN